MKSGNWRLVVCGVNHKTSSLEQREPLQLGPDDLPRANALFGSLPEVFESAIVATCNRGEFYFVTGRDNEPFDVVTTFYERFKGLDILPYRALFQTRKGRHVADHLFRVAAGVDSMILGENQIMGQVKDAYSCACAVKSAGKVIHRLFHQAFRVGKRVRTDTEIGKGACSVSTAAVDMIKDRVEGMEKPAVLFVGINQMINLAAKRLGQINGCRLLFANRTAEKAATFAAKFDAEGFGLDRIRELMTRADVVIGCTSSAEPIVTRDAVTDVLDHRSGRPLIVLDIAVPRDFDIPKDLDPLIEVNDLEDVERFVKDRQHERELAIPQAEEIIERKLDEFDYWYKQVLYEPIYNGRANTVESIRDEELAAVLKKLPPELQDELNEATRRIVDRVLRAANRPTTHSPGQ
jgi:glutamyl-tRNA reductase